MDRNVILASLHRTETDISRLRRELYPDDQDIATLRHLRHEAARFTDMLAFIDAR